MGWNGVGMHAVIIIEFDCKFYFRKLVASWTAAALALQFEAGWKREEGGEVEAAEAGGQHGLGRASPSERRPKV